MIPAPVCREVDYLLRTRVRRAARMAFLDDLAAASFTVPCLEPDDSHFILLPGDGAPRFERTS